MRIGQGYDVHKLVMYRPLILGGVNIEHTHGLAGHSDADVLVHAIMDSLLGAIAFGDIGNLFPDTEKRFKNANSLKLLEQVCDLIDENNYKIINIDSTIIAQEPKIAPYIERMRKNIAGTCSIDISAVSVKATTEENLGFTGRREGISAYAVCLIDNR